MYIPGPTAAEDKLTDEQREKGMIVMDPRWGYRVMKESNGLIHPPYFKAAACEDLRTRFEIQSHDIMITTYPKCGTTWMQQVILLLLKGSEAEVIPTQHSKWIERSASGGINENDVTAMSVDEMIELPPPSEEDSNFRVWKTHATVETAPWKGGVAQAQEAGAKIVVASRNPKDAVISKYHHTKRVDLGFDGGMNEFFPLYLDGKVVYNSFWDWHRDWWNAKEKYSDTILWVHFEDMKKDLKKEIKRVAEFLNLERSDEELDKVTDRCTFKSMKSEADTRGDFAKNGAKSSHFRSGKSGGWIDVMTPEVVEAFDEKTEKMYSECTLRFHEKA